MSVRGTSVLPVRRRWCVPPRSVTCPAHTSHPELYPVPESARGSSTTKLSALAHLPIPVGGVDRMAAVAQPRVRRHVLERLENLNRTATDKARTREKEARHTSNWHHVGGRARTNKHFLPRVDRCTWTLNVTARHNTQAVGSLPAVLFLVRTATLTGTYFPFRKTMTAYIRFSKKNVSHAYRAHEA